MSEKKYKITNSSAQKKKKRSLRCLVSNIFHFFHILFDSGNFNCEMNKVNISEMTTTERHTTDHRIWQRQVMHELNEKQNKTKISRQMREHAVLHSTNENCGIETEEKKNDSKSISMKSARNALSNTINRRTAEK